MGFRFRKSKKIGPVRVTLSKSGIGYSIGTKGLRFTKKAGGGTRTTASIPGTGISYVKDSSGTRKASSAAAYDTGPELTPAGSGGDGVTLTEVLLAWLLGWAGGHKFYRRKFGMGILYFFTFGLLCIGWFGDALWLTLRFVMQSRGSEPPKASRVALFIVAVLVLAVLGSCHGRSGSPAESQEPLKDLTKAAASAAVPAETSTPTFSPSENPVEATLETTVEASAPTEASISAEPEETTDNITSLAVLPVMSDTSEPTADTSVETTEPVTTVPETTEPPTETTVPETTKPEAPKLEYVLNTSTMRFHYPSCKSVKKIKDSNKGSFTGTRDEVISKGYQPCGNCHP